MHPTWISGAINIKEAGMINCICFNQSLKHNKKDYKCIYFCDIRVEDSLTYITFHESTELSAYEIINDLDDINILVA